jgi:hypothetical protein
MAFTGTAYSLTSSGFDLNAALTNLTGGLSICQMRWVRAVLDSRMNGKVHIVVGIEPQDAGANAGVVYIQWNAILHQVDKWAFIEEPEDGAGAGWNNPDIAYDVRENRIWIVYNETDSYGTADQPLARYSDDGGTTWSARQGIGVTGTFSCPKIAFGTSGDGAILLKNATTFTWYVVHYEGAGSWGTPVSLRVDASWNPASDNTADVAVNGNGNIVAVVDTVHSATFHGMSVFMYNKTTDTWTEQEIAQVTGTGADFSKMHVQAGNDNSFVVLGLDNKATDQLHLKRISNALAVTNLATLTPGNQGTGAWLAYTLDAIGDVHVFYRGASATACSYFRYVATTNLWDAAIALETTYNYVTTGPMENYGIAESTGSMCGDLVAFGDQLIWFIGAASDPGGGTREDLYTDYDPTRVVGGDEAMFSNRGRIVGLTEFISTDDAAEAQRRLIVYAGDSIFHDNDESEFTGNQIYQGAFEPVPDFAVMEDKLWIADGGTTTLKYWDTDLAIAQTVNNTWDGNLAGDPAPKPYIIEVAKNRLWAVTPDNPRRLLFSGLRFPEYWNLTQDDATVDEDDPGFIYMDDLPFGEPITALGELQGNRYIFSENGIMEVSGDTPFVGLSADINAAPFLARIVSKTVGATCNRAVVNIGTDILFLSRKGVHSLLATEKFGAVEETYLSYAIQPLFDSLNKDLFVRATAVNYRRKNWYVLNVSRDVDEGKMKTLLILDYGQGLWTMWTMPFEVLCLFSRSNPDTKQEQLLAGTDRGHVMILDQDARQDDVDGEYTSIIKSSRLSGSGPNQYDLFARLVVHFWKPDVVNVTGRYWIDDQAPVSFTLGQNPYDEDMIGTATIGSGDTDPTAVVIDGAVLAPFPQHVIINRRGRTFQFELTCPEGNHAVSGFELWFIPGSDRNIIQ